MSYTAKCVIFHFTMLLGMVRNAHLAYWISEEKKEKKMDDTKGKRRQGKTRQGMCTFESSL